MRKLVTLLILISLGLALTSCSPKTLISAVIPNKSEQIKTRLNDLKAANFPTSMSEFDQKLEKWEDSWPRIKGILKFDNSLLGWARAGSDLLDHGHFEDLTMINEVLAKNSKLREQAKQILAKNPTFVIPLEETSTVAAVQNSRRILEKLNAIIINFCLSSIGASFNKKTTEAVSDLNYCVYLVDQMHKSRFRYSSEVSNMLQNVCKTVTRCATNDIKSKYKYWKIFSKLYTKEKKETLLVEKFKIARMLDTIRSVDVSGQRSSFWDFGLGKDILNYVPIKSYNQDAMLQYLSFAESMISDQFFSESEYDQRAIAFSNAQRTVQKVVISEKNLNITHTEYIHFNTYQNLLYLYRLVFIQSNRRFQDRTFDNDKILPETFSLGHTEQIDFAGFSTGTRIRINYYDHKHYKEELAYTSSALEASFPYVDSVQSQEVIDTLTTIQDYRTKASRRGSSTNTRK